MDNFRERVSGGKKPVTLTLTRYSRNISAGTTSSDYIYVYADGIQINPKDCSISKSGNGAYFSRNTTYITITPYSNGNTTRSRTTILTISYGGGTAQYTIVQAGDEIINCYTFGIQNIRGGFYCRATTTYNSTSSKYSTGYRHYLNCDITVYSTTAYKVGGNRVGGLTLVDTITNQTVLTGSSATGAYDNWRYSQSKVPTDTPSYNKVNMFYQGDSKPETINYVLYSRGYTPYYSFQPSSDSDSSKLGQEFSNYTGYITTEDYTHYVENGGAYTATVKLITGNCVGVSTQIKQAKITANWESYVEGEQMIASYTIEIL